ncbi:sodium:glutamate symporter [Bacillaceae bacterium SAOS 7]|nr:sodium:glutamate symporter [Bacillaceae bacterium SAOS 7]
MDNFSIWSLMLDISIISGLLLISTILRAKVKWIQSLFLPASMLAGFLGLGLGPSGLNILPFSAQMSTYPGLLIAVIFAALPIGAKTVKMKHVLGRVRNMWSYSMLLTTLMWGGGALFGLMVINQLFGDLHAGFGLMLGAGFLGGHGTAAALGETFSEQGWEEALTLGMTSATVGILVAILGGLFIIKRHTKKGHTNFISSFSDLPNELKTGLVPAHNRSSMGEETVSSNSIDPLVLHLSLTAFVVGLAYWISNVSQDLLGNIALPLFSIAFIVGLLLQTLLRKTGADQYVDHHIMNRIGGSATDYLVAFGMASINLSVVVDYAVPLTLLFAFGIAWAYMIFRFIGPNIFQHYWFEKSLFGWGWSTGTVAMGLALLRIVDPKLKSKTMDDYAIAYLGMIPVEMTIISMAPILYMSGLPWVFPTVLLLVGIAIIAVYRLKGWWGQSATTTSSQPSEVLKKNA